MRLDIEDEITGTERNIAFMENELNKTTWSDGQGGGGSELEGWEKDQIKVQIRKEKKYLRILLKKEANK